MIAELEPAATVGRLLPQHPGQLGAVRAGVEQDRHGMHRQVMLHVQHRIVPQESPRKRAIVTRLELDVDQPGLRTCASGASPPAPPPATRILAALEWWRSARSLDKRDAGSTARSPGRPRTVPWRRRLR